MKLIYNTPTKEAAKTSLEDFSKKWNHKYPYAIKFGEENGEELTAFLTFH
jgi:putative transposase